MLHGYAAARVGGTVMTMSIFRGAGKPILRECRNRSAERNERYSKAQRQFSTQACCMRCVIESRFGNDSVRTRVHVVESTTAQTISDGTMNLRFVTKERTTLIAIKAGKDRSYSRGPQRRTELLEDRIARKIPRERSEAQSAVGATYG